MQSERELVGSTKMNIVRIPAGWRFLTATEKHRA